MALNQKYILSNTFHYFILKIIYETRYESRCRAFRSGEQHITSHWKIHLAKSPYLEHNTLKNKFYNSDRSTCLDGKINRTSTHSWIQVKFQTFFNNIIWNVYPIFLSLYKWLCRRGCDSRKFHKSLKWIKHSMGFTPIRLFLSPRHGASPGLRMGE